MKLAIVGSRSLEGHPQLKAVIRDFIDQLHPDMIVTGGARGVDTAAMDVGRERGLAVLVFWPKKQVWAGKGGFQERNQKIAAECDVLVAILDKNSKTHGGLWTASCAQSLGKEVVINDRLIPQPPTKEAGSHGS